MGVMRALALPVLCALTMLGLVGCGSAPRPVPVAAVPPPPPIPVVRETGIIHRAALDEVLDAGIGRFLGRMEVSPVMDGETFVGFELTTLRDEALFGGVDLLPGDRIVSVNGQSIERPDDAFTVWSGLRVASELALVVSRAGETRELRFAIVD